MTEDAVAQDPEVIFEAINGVIDDLVGHEGSVSVVIALMRALENELEILAQEQAEAAGADRALRSN